MPQLLINNASIDTFRFGVQFDIYQRKVTFTDMSTYNGSSGSGVFNILGISFSLIDQQGIELATIDFSDASKYIVPSDTNEFEVDLSSLNYNFLFQTYLIKGAIKDGGGTIYYTNPVYKDICSPLNINDGGYVPGIFQIAANCPDNVITVKELTVFTYSNKNATTVTKSGTLSYPTGTISAVTFTGTPFSNDVVRTGEYRINCTSEAEYDMDDDVTVLVTYLTNNVFDITCANKIADLICCMVSLQSTYLKNCNNATGRNAKQQLDEVSIPFMLGLVKEINGQDASTEAALIRKTLNCDCGATSVHQNEFTPINPSVTNIVLAGVGGTTIPSPTTNGNTKTYNIASNVYQVVKGNTGDLAFTITVDTSTQYMVKYKITFNYDTMANYILTAIGNNSTLVTQLNSLISSTGGVDISGLDGKCVIDLSSTNYLLTQSITGSTKVVSITTATTTYAAPANLFASSAASVQSWLNGLGIGAFSVNSVGSIISVLSLNNTNSLSALNFSSPDLTVVFQSTNVTLVSVLQAIIDYLCELTALQIGLGNAITLWQIDYNGIATSQGFEATASQATLNQGIATSIYNIVQTLSTLTGVTCAKIKAVFQDSPNTAFSASGRLYGTLDGDNCAALTDKQVATLVIAAIQNYSDVKTLFCAIDCEVPGTCPDIADFSVSMVGANIGIFQVVYSQTPLATQSLTVLYKKTTSVSYTVATNALSVLPNGLLNINPPYLILNPVQGETYDIKIVNNCGGVGFVKQITIPTGSAYAGSYGYGNVIYDLCGGGTTTLYTSAPFAVGQIVYTNIGMTIPLTGYNFIVDSTGEIYTIDSVTGEVLTDTLSTCSNGITNEVVLGNDTGTICGLEVTTGYTNGAFVVGGTLYQDASLTTPVTGYSYVVNTANNHIYNLNSVTGVIGSDTTLSCSSYSGLFKTDNLEATICLVPDVLRYSASPFEPGVTMYTNSGLTTLLTGFQYIRSSDGTIYNLNTYTGVVGAVTGGSC